MESPKTIVESYEPTDTVAPKSNQAYLSIKRFQDIVLSTLALIVLSPLLLLVSILIVLDDPHGGPIFVQERVGKDGQMFHLFKLRTMKNHSEQLETSLSIEQLKQYKREFKLDNDFRITRLGHFLRKYSVDELPQLVNVLCGHMSLIGPRPLIRDELEAKYSIVGRKLLLSVRPGLTGLWQVNGRNGCTYENGERQRLELYYVQNISLRMDASILIKTVKVVFSGTGI